MDCLLCIASIYLSGSLGLQAVSTNEFDRSNDYGLMVGTVELVIEAENNMFVKLIHNSGVNTVENDWGKNSIEAGGKLYLFKRNN